MPWTIIPCARGTCTRGARRALRSSYAGRTWCGGDRGHTCGGTGAKAACRTRKSCSFLTLSCFLKCGSASHPSCGPPSPSLPSAAVELITHPSCGTPSPPPPGDGLRPAAGKAAAEAWGSVPLAPGGGREGGGTGAQGSLSLAWHRVEALKNGAVLNRPPDSR